MRVCRTLCLAKTSVCVLLLCVLIAPRAVAQEPSDLMIKVLNRSKGVTTRPAVTRLDTQAQRPNTAPKTQQIYGGSLPKADRSDAVPPSPFSVLPTDQRSPVQSWQRSFMP